MKTKRIILTATATGIVAVGAAVLCVWQQHRIAQSRGELERQRSEAAQLPELRAELARLRQVAMDQAELARLRQQQSADQLELLRLRAKAASGRRAELEATDLRAQLERQAAEGSGASNGIAGPMAELMQGGFEQMTQRRLARMQERLNLSPAQTEAIQQILSRRAQGIAEATRGVLSGKLDHEKLAALRQGRGDPESEIRTLLSPEQQADYAALQEEEKLNSARLSANSELLQMQHTLGLTENQTEGVFAVLYDQALQQHHAEATEPEPKDPTEAQERVLNRKLEALEGVLTPTQLAGYRQQQELQLAFLKRLVSRVEP